MSNPSSFQLSDTVDNNKIFLVNLSEIEGRIDPSPYKSSFAFESNIFPSFRLNKIAYINPTTTFPTTPEATYSFIPMDAVSDKNGNIKYTLEKPITEIKGFTKFKSDDLIWAKITPCMQNGKSAVVKGTTEYVCGSTEFHVIRTRSDELNIEYLHFILRDPRILDAAKNFFGGSAGQQRVSDIFLKTLNIPLPPRNIQDEFMTLWERVKTLSIEKKAQAQNLLTSIDDYLLTELGINVPEVDNSLSSRIFTVQASDLKDSFAPAVFFNEKYEVEGGLFENFNLSEVVNLQKGKSITSANIHKGDYPVIAGGQTSPYSHNTFNFTGETITISASGAYSGYVWFHNYSIFASDCLVLTAKSSPLCSMKFIYEVLKAKQKDIYRLQKGAGQPHVYARDLQYLQIPIPPTDIQKKIVHHIDHIRATAAQLQKDADEILADAKQRIESMILGEEV